MPDERKPTSVRSRNEAFTKRTTTKIWSETPSNDNPYIAASAACHGYDLLELMEKRSFVDVFYLLFKGELPNTAEAKILEALMVALINPGPRHPATRAAMNAGIGKTNPLHILPIASAILGGDYTGGGDIENTMRFLRRQQGTDPQSIVSTLQLKSGEKKSGTDKVAEEIPGFGTRFGGVDIMAEKIAAQLSGMDGAGSGLKWGNSLSEKLKPHGLGWLITGVAAAIFADLGFQPRAGGCLFQLLGAPGLLAHGLELANKPITAMPFVSDENYVIER